MLYTPRFFLFQMQFDS